MPPITPEELSQELRNLPIGSRKTLREWGNLMSAGIVGGSRDDQEQEGEGVLRIHTPQPHFDPKRGLLMIRLNKTTLVRAIKLTTVVNEVAGGEIILVANDLEYFPPWILSSDAELKWYVVIKIKCDQHMLAGVLRKLPDGPTTKNGPQRVIIRDVAGGEYHYRGQRIPFNKNNLYFHIFEFLFGRHDGMATYKEIDIYLASKGKGSMGDDLKKISRRIRNAINNGYKRNSKLPQEIGDRDVLEFDRTLSRVCFYNPELKS